MQKYESKITKSRRMASDLYARFTNLEEVARMFPPDQFQPVELSPDRCVFDNKQFGQIGFQIVDREENKTIKVADINGKPFTFFLWFQFKEVGSYDTRIRITLHIGLPSIMKFAMKGKIQKALDQFAETIAQA
jgi:hypothetical protein